VKLGRSKLLIKANKLTKDKLKDQNKPLKICHEIADDGCSLEKQKHL
jgi:hypothetical protein